MCECVWWGNDSHSASVCCVSHPHSDNCSKTLHTPTHAPQVYLVSNFSLPSNAHTFIDVFTVIVLYSAGDVQLVYLAVSFIFFL